jgi:DNA adenine methylase
MSRAKGAARLASPLRYPGGKACLYDIVKTIIAHNSLEQRQYVEPYSGGCGLALSLLYNGHVTAVHLNDADRSVWAFWHAVLNLTDDLVREIERAELSVNEWERQRSVQNRKADADPLELGFSTFYLNRTNRSGVIHSGGIIGGRDQAGPYKIDCRFNKIALIERILRASRYRGRIHLYNEDAEDFLANTDVCYPQTSIIYIDPPYVGKGSSLYRNSYSAADHRRLADLFATLENPWFLTYDNVELVRQLYCQYGSVELDIGYSAHSRYRGSELLVFSPKLHIPSEFVIEARAA